jgi:MFS family permease
VVWNVITVSLRQRIIPDQLLGRVNSAYRLLAWGTQPLGALLGGILAEALGLPAVFLIGGALALTLLFARLVIDEAAIQQAEDAAVPAPA